MRPPQRGVQHLTGDNVRGDGDWGKIGELIGGDHVAMRKTDATNAWVGAVVRQSQLTGGVRVSTVRGGVDVDVWGHTDNWRERWTNSWARASTAH
jgi:hypothetical protein